MSISQSKQQCNESSSSAGRAKLWAIKNEHDEYFLGCGHWSDDAGDGAPFTSESYPYIARIMRSLNVPFATQLVVWQDGASSPSN